MNGSCAFASDMGVVRNMLAAVDCNTRHFAMLGYQSLTASPMFQTALTVCLTLYVALIGYRLLFAPDGMRLSEGPGMALRIGAILALVSGWGLFQTLVFDIADRAPLEIAGLISAPTQDNSPLAADPVEGMQSAYDQLSTAASSFGKTAGTTARSDTSQNGEAAELLAIAAGVVFFCCAGLLAVTLIAIGVLTAAGPVFVTLLLFFETRGFFIGWVRALAAAAFALLSTWTSIVLMLHVTEPWLLELAEQREAGSIEGQTAMTAASIVFVFAACQLGMIVAGFVVASGFSPAARRRTHGTARSSVRQSGEPLVLAAISRPAWLAEQLQRPAAAVSPARTAAFATLEHSAPAEIFVAPETFGRNHYRRPTLSHRDETRGAKPA